MEMGCAASEREKVMISNLWSENSRRYCPDDLCNCPNPPCPFAQKTANGATKPKFAGLQACTISAFMLLLNTV